MLTYIKQIPFKFLNQYIFRQYYNIIYNLTNFTHSWVEGVKEL